MVMKSLIDLWISAEVACYTLLHQTLPVRGSKQFYLTTLQDL